MWHIKVEKASIGWFTGFYGSLLIWQSWAHDNKNIWGHTEDHDVQLLNLEDSPNHFSFSSNMFACEKWHFPLLLWGYLVFAVRIFGVVLTGELFQRLTSWTLRWFLKLLGRPKNVWNHSGIFKSNHQPCCQEANPNGCPKSAFQSPARASPSLLNLAGSHTLHRLPLAFHSLSPKPSAWLRLLPPSSNTYHPPLKG